MSDPWDDAIRLYVSNLWARDWYSEEDSTDD